MNLKHKVWPIKTRKTGLVGFRASYGDLETSTEPTRQEALDALAKLVDARCAYISTDLKVLALAGHVGIFSRTLDGSVETRHVWPDGHTSHMIGGGDLLQAQVSFRYHVAQQEWDGVSTASPLVPEKMAGEFRSWCEFQFRHRYGREVLGLADGPLYLYACDARNQGYDEAVAADLLAQQGYDEVFGADDDEPPTSVIVGGRVIRDAAAQ